MAGNSMHMVVVTSLLAYMLATTKKEKPMPDSDAHKMPTELNGNLYETCGDDSQY